MTGIASGLGAYVGLGKESAYGTPVAATDFFEFASETFALDVNYQQSRGLRAGRSFAQARRRTQTTRSAGGAFNLDIPTLGVNALLDLLHDEVITLADFQGVKKAVHVLGGDPSTKSASIHIGRATSEGVMHDFAYVGQMVTQWAMQCAVGELLTGSLTFDGMDEIIDDATKPSLGSITYPDAMSWSFAQGVVLIDGDECGVVRNCSFNGGSPRKVDRFFFGSNGRKRKPIANDYASVEGSLGVEFADLSMHDHFIAGDMMELVLRFEGENLTGSAPATKRSLEIKAEAIGFNSSNPQVSGPDVIDEELPFVALDKTGAPLTFTVVTDETSL